MSVVQRDPLAGQRQAINDRIAASLMWADDGGPCPVKVGETYTLRSCSIEIIETRRIKHQGVRKWRAAFTRTDRVADRLHLIPRNGDGYTSDPKLAVGIGEDIFGQPPPTLDSVDEDQRSAEHRNAGQPPEPEAVPPHEIKEYQGSREARQRYQLDMARERMETEALPLSERLRRLEESGGGVDLSRQFARIEDTVARAEAKRRRAATASKVPSEQVA